MPGIIGNSSSTTIVGMMFISTVICFRLLIRLGLDEALGVCKARFGLNSLLGDKDYLRENALGEGDCYSGGKKPILVLALSAIMLTGLKV